METESQDPTGNGRSDPSEGEKTTLKILHLGDVFLDSPVERLRRDTKEHRREELREAFASFMQRVDEEKANAVIFSGNLFDSRYVGEDTLRFLLKSFGARPSCHFVIAPGPFDPYDKQSIYRSKRFPRNVHVFLEEVLGTYNFFDLPLTVYGWGYCADRLSHAPLTGASKGITDRFSVLCGYARLDAEATLVDAAAVAAFGAHYTALSGAPHSGFQRSGDGICAYSGSFEGRDDGTETEIVGGYIRVCAQKSEDGWHVAAERVPLDTYLYVTERLDVSHLSSHDTVRARAEAMIRDAGYGAKTVLRLILFGSVPLSVNFATVELPDHGLYALHVEDHTVPTDNAEFLLREMNARGELYRHFYPQMTGGTETERARAARAFRIGYAALCGEDFAKY